MMRLNHGNELTLKRRLDALVGVAGSPLVEQVARCDRLVRRIVNKRNEMTHGDRLEPTLTDAQMFWAEKMLHAIFLAVLLRELGYEPEYVDAATRRSPAWRYLREIPRDLLNA